MRLNFFDGGSNQIIIVKRKFNLNLITLTFSTGMTDDWHIIRAAALWKIIAMIHLQYIIY